MQASACQHQRFLTSKTKALQSPAYEVNLYKGALQINLTSTEPTHREVSDNFQMPQTVAPEYRANTQRIFVNFQSPTHHSAELTHAQGILENFKSLYIPQSEIMYTDLPPSKVPPKAAKNQRKQVACRKMLIFEEIRIKSTFLKLFHF